MEWVTNWIAERLAAVPELTLTDVRSDLAGHGTEVSYTSVWRTVKKLGLRLNIRVILKYYWDKAQDYSFAWETRAGHPFIGLEITSAL